MEDLDQLRKNSDIFLVVMAGGSGTRFWPKSTARRPKQLLSFFSGTQSLLRQTLDRFEDIVPLENRIIVTTQLLEHAIQHEAPEAKILVEPQGRNTAPCIFWAARHIYEKNPEAVMAVMPSDHFIATPAAFLDVFCQAIDRARVESELITLAVKPTRPETGYGYLLKGTSLGENIFKVNKFIEKPNIEKAKSFVANGDYFWNGGMFLWRVSTILSAFEKYMPELTKAWDNARGDVTEAYPQMTATSIDFGVMEKADNVTAFPLDCGWDDLGNWTSLEALGVKMGLSHPSGVVLSGDTLAIQSSGNIVDVNEWKVALLGAKDMIIVKHGSVLLIAQKEYSQEIRKLVEEAKKKWPELV